jgi:4-amino-4-deoxy-L-arabinose transferase-like glycosyltransferase
MPCPRFFACRRSRPVQVQWRAVRRTTALLLILGWAAFFAGLGRPAIGDSDEAFYAEAGREMVESGDWLTPHYNHQPRFQKPILTYWLIAAAYRVAGVQEGAARIWSALAGLALAMLTAAVGRRWYDEATGRLAGAIVATAFGYFSIARLSLPDLPLTALVSLAVYAAIQAALDRSVRPSAWWAVAGVATGLGLLTKGPVALVLVVVVVLPILWRDRSVARGVTRGLLMALALAIAVAVPWYAAMVATHGEQYLRGFLVGDNLERFATARFNDPRPWWFYLPILAGGLLPWTPLAACAVGPLVRAWREEAPVAATWRLTWWTLGPLLFFTASVGKQPRYILPMLPPLALLLARGLASYVRAARLRRSWWTLRTAGAATGLFLVGLAMLLHRATPVVVHVEPWLVATGAGLIALGGVALSAVSVAGVPAHVPLTTALAGALALAGLQYGLSSTGHAAVQEMAAHVTEHRSAGERVGTYRVFVRNLVFYTHVPTDDLTTPEELRAFLEAPGRALCVMRKRDVDGIRPVAPGLRILEETLYVNASPVRLRALFSPNPARDLEPVVLVTNR